VIQKKLDGPLPNRSTKTTRGAAGTTLFSAAHWIGLPIDLCGGAAPAIHRLQVPRVAWSHASDWSTCPVVGRGLAASPARRRSTRTTSSTVPNCFGSEGRHAGVNRLVCSTPTCGRSSWS